MSQHHHRCDYSLNPVPDDAECYCPMPGEELLRCGHLQEESCNCADYEDCDCPSLCDLHDNGDYHD